MLDPNEAKTASTVISDYLEYCRKKQGRYRVLFYAIGITSTLLQLTLVALAIETMVVVALQSCLIWAAVFFTLRATNRQWIAARTAILDDIYR